MENAYEDKQKCVRVTVSAKSLWESDAWNYGNKVEEQWKPQ